MENILKKKQIKSKRRHLSRTGYLYDLKMNYNLYLMILPVALGFIIFHYLPMYGIIIAFKDYDLIKGYMSSPWVGLKHFISFAKDPYFPRVVRNTFILGFYSLLWGFWPPIVLALLLNEVKDGYFKRITQTISYFPHFISVVVIVGMMMEMLGPKGFVNNLLNAWGKDSIAFFNDAKYFRMLYILSGIWQGIGWSSILYLATLSGVDQELYEAAYIDGANRFQRVWHISLPSIMPTITILLILNTANIIDVGFEKVYLMSNPSLYETADVIQTYVYRRGIINKNFSYATAIGLMNSIIAFLLLYVANFISRKKGETSLW
ncbi:MAG: ABC transporter permease subunit [Firmicutes bacterium]|nr:ABC transporter permease subunit [Bacillota bacterium]